MALEKYHRKRDFKRTAEPEGKVGETPTGRLFVVQKHAASRLHYDLRLELDGVLKSWAVPKGPSLNPSEKRLAIHVEDHPIEYGSFEGLIPRGEYGGGTVMLWDSGVWEPLGDPREGYARGDLKFSLMGHKLRGSFVLARMKDKAGEEGKNWLLIKKRDEAAVSGPEPQPVDHLDRSVLTGRTMDEIAAGREKVWYEGKAVAGSDMPVEAPRPSNRSLTAHARTEIDPSALPGARPAPRPETFRPQLATLAGAPPEGENWVHEIKYDGYRIVCMLSDGRARLISRNGLDWTSKFSAIADLASTLPVESAILDGEVVVLTPEGRADFQALQNTLKGTGSGRLVYYVFDIPYCRGYNLTRTPLTDRKELLRRLFDIFRRVEGPDNGAAIGYAEHIRGKGPVVFSQACGLSLEGIVSKQAQSPYEQKRSRRWVKVKCSHRQEFVIGGYTDPAGSRTGFGALLLGFYDPEGKLVYAGKVGTGFNDKILADLSRRLKELDSETAHFANPPMGHEAKGAHWVRPELVGEVEFSQWTEEGVLRHPSFKGLREDKSPLEVVRETPRQQEQPPLSQNIEALPGAGTGAPALHVPLSNPARVLYPDIGITKQDLAEYYADVAKWMLPHLLRRPLTLVRCPEGWNRQCFFHKHLGETAPDVLRAIQVMEKGGRVEYSVVDNPEGIVALAQTGALEIHVWGSREPKIEQPDMMIFDLDPAPGVAWEKMITAAFLLRSRLADLGLASFVKTTGGKGLHVATPLTPRLDWDAVKEFSRAVAESIVREFPHDYIATMSKAKREGKIFIDYLRNGRGATSIAAFSTRAKKGAPVSAPVSWEELTPELRPDAFNIGNIRQRLASLKKDPWEGYFAVRQSITVKMRTKVGLGDPKGKK